MAAIPRRVRVTLSRRTRPRRGRPGTKRKTVVVECLTLERLMALLKISFHRATVLSLKSKDGISGYDWLSRFTPKEQCDLVALACPSHPPGFFKAWATKENLLRIAGAMLDTNDVEGVLAALDLTGKPHPGKGGNIHSDVAAMCQLHPGLTPPQVWAWYADQFFEACIGLRVLEEIRRQAKDDPPAMQRDPIESFEGIDGIGIIH